MIKILFLTTHSQIGGGETSLINIVKSLNKRKFKPIVVIPRKGQLKNELDRLRIKTYTLPFTPYFVRQLFIPGLSPISAIKLLKLTHKLKPDIIHINHLNLAFYALIASKILKTPTIGTAHGKWDSVYFFQDLLTNIATNKLIASSYSLKNFLTKNKTIARQKVSVIPFAINTNKFSPGNKTIAKRKLQLKPSDLVVTIVGRLDPIKDHLTFLKAAQIIKNEIPNVKFLIVGSKLGDFSNKNSYQKQIYSYLRVNPQLKKSVNFLGFQKEMQIIYNASDIVVSTSLSESFGLVFLEAGACKTPVVATNEGIQKKIVIINKTGFLTSPKKPQEIAEKTIKLLKNKKLREKFGQNARNHILSNYNFKNYINRLEKLYLSQLQNA